MKTCPKVFSCSTNISNKQQKIVALCLKIVVPQMKYLFSINTGINYTKCTMANSQKATHKQRMFKSDSSSSEHNFFCQ